MDDTKWVTSSVTTTRDVTTDGMTHFTFKEKSEFSTPMPLVRMNEAAAAPRPSGSTGRPTPTFKEEEQSRDALNSTIPWASSQPNQVQAKMAASHHHHVAGIGPVVHRPPHHHAPCLPHLPAHLPYIPAPHAAASRSQHCCCPAPCRGQSTPSAPSTAVCPGHYEQLALYVDDVCRNTTCPSNKED